MNEHVRTEIDAGIMTLTLARADKKNALSNAMYSAMSDGLERAEKDPAVRVVTQGPAIRAAAETAGLPLAVSLVEMGTSAAGYRAAVESISRDGADAVMVVESPETEQKGALIVKLIGDAKLPAIFSFTESVEAEGLMAYSFDLIELFKRSAHTIDAILL